MPLRMSIPRLFCALLLVAPCGYSAPVPVPVPAPALQVDRIQGSAQLQRLGQHSPLHRGDDVLARDVVKLGDGARLSLSLAGSGVFELADAAQISIERLPSIASLAKPDSAKLPTPVIVNLEHGDLHLMWRPAQAAIGAPEPHVQPLYVFFAKRRVALLPGEYFFHQGKTDSQLCVVQGQASTMTIAAGQRHVLKVDDCENRQGRVTQVVADGAGKWKRMRQHFAIADNTDDDVNATLTALKLDQRLTPAQESSASAKSRPAISKSQQPDTTDGVWAVNVASYSARDDAQQQQQALKTSGYRAVVVPAQVDDKTWYRVQVTGFATPAAAHATAVALQSNLGYQQLWVMHRQ